MLKVKVCGLTDCDNLKEIARLSPDFMGFIFFRGSKRFAGDKLDPSFIRHVPGSVLKTGVFVNEKLSEVLSTVNRYSLDLVQLHGDETAGYCSSLKMKGLRVIKAFGINEKFNFDITEEYLDHCDYFLFDTGSGDCGGSGMKFDWNIISGYNPGKKFILAGGIGPEDAEPIKKLRHENLVAVDINSRFEVTPGIKDYDLVRDFINEIKS